MYTYQRLCVRKRFRISGDVTLLGLDQFGMVWFDSHLASNLQNTCKLSELRMLLFLWGTR